MEAHRQTVVVAGLTPEDTIPTWPEPRFESTAPGSGTRLASSERPTLPPPGADVMVSHIHLGPSVDEVLYRLSLGDLTGAALANEELEAYVPTRNMAPVVVAAMGLTYLEEFMLAAVDGDVAWGDLIDSSPFPQKDTLKALCELVDKGAVALTRVTP